MRAYAFPGTRVMREMWTGSDCLKDEGCSRLTVNHSLSFADPGTGAYTQRSENTWRVFKRSMPHTGTSKISSKATYRDSRGVNNMEIILLETFSSVSPTYMKCAKMRKLLLMPLYALFAFRSPLHGGKKETKCTASSRGSEFEERNQGEKTRRDTKSKPEFFLTLF